MQAVKTPQKRTGSKDADASGVSEGERAYQKLKSAAKNFFDFFVWPTAVLNDGYTAAKGLFDPRGIDGIFNERIQKADFRAGFLIFLAASILCALIIWFGFIAQAYLQAYTYDAVRQQVAGSVDAAVNSAMGPASATAALFVPLSLLFTLVIEGIVYLLAKATHGKGTLSTQFYLSSLVGLSRAIMSLVMLFGIIYCLGTLVVIAYIIILAYLLLYVTPKAYSKAHSIRFFHALILTILSYAIPLGLIYLLNSSMLKIG